MSRIGKKPIQIPEGINTTIESGKIVVKGPKGEITLPIALNLVVKTESGQLFVERKNESKQAKSDHGALASQLLNAIYGVTDGWSKTLELVGTGYRARLEGDALILAIGFSHPVRFEPQENIKFSVEENKIVVSGIDKHKVGQMAANVRKVRPPEVYKGKGIKYLDERVRRKAGKAAKAAA